MPETAAPTFFRPPIGPFYAFDHWLACEVVSRTAASIRLWSLDFARQATVGLRLRLQFSEWPRAALPPGAGHTAGAFNVQPILKRDPIFALEAYHAATAIGGTSFEHFPHQDARQFPCLLLACSAVSLNASPAD